MVISGTLDPRPDQCRSPGRPVDVRLLWGVSKDDGFDDDPSSIFAEQPMQLEADGIYRARIETGRYFDELMVVGHYQTTSYRCDWGNG